jgi:hypothetical protein
VTSGQSQSEQFDLICATEWENGPMIQNGVAKNQKSSGVGRDTFSIDLDSMTYVKNGRGPLKILEVTEQRIVLQRVRDESNRIVKHVDEYFDRRTGTYLFVQSTRSLIPEPYIETTNSARSSGQCLREEFTPFDKKKF